MSLLSTLTVALPLLICNAGDSPKIWKRVQDAEHQADQNDDVLPERITIHSEIRKKKQMNKGAMRPRVWTKLDRLDRIFW